MRILVTGGAGFIGGHVVEYLVAQGHEVCVATRSTYAGKLRNLAAVLSRIELLIGDLAEAWFAKQCAQWAPQWVIHMAAETHVDHAIADPMRFIRANVGGTTQLLQALVNRRPPDKILVYSTDEVYGPTPPGHAFTEAAPFRPSNAYAASKVGVEGVAQAFWVTHRLPIVVVRPCNTYGPRQHPEKVIPKFVRQLLRGQAVTLYNDGGGSRDWLAVQDHARAVGVLLSVGQPGEAYNLGAATERTDLEICHGILDILRVRGDIKGGTVHYVRGRPGHDRRYAMRWNKLEALGWAPQACFEDEFVTTVVWNVEHQDWWETEVVSGAQLAGVHETQRRCG